MSALADLLASDPAPAIDEAALVLAHDALAGVDVEALRAELDAMAAPLRASLPSHATPDEAAHRLAERVYGQLGFAGNDQDYYDPANSYLDRVIRRRTGIPISLATILIAVGRRAGVLVEGIGFPGHFLARVGGKDGVFVEPFVDGSILTEAAIHQLAHRVLGDVSRLDPEHLRPVGTRAMIVRMLSNLQLAHRQRGEHGEALLAADRLVELTGLPEHRRDRGVHALSFGSWGTAVDDLEAYLSARPEARDREPIERALGEARRRLQTALC